MKKFLIIIGLLVIVMAGVFVFTNPVAWFFQPTSSSEPQATTSMSVTSSMDSVDAVNDLPDIAVIATDLSVPWGLAFLPGGNLLVSERVGYIRELTTEGETVVRIPVSGSAARGEAGLLGVALHPDFSNNSWIYIYQTTSVGDGLQNQVLRFTYESEELTNREVILDGIAGAPYHDGGRIAFGPDGNLYIATGDATDPSLAQRTDNLEGKILRITDDGSIPDDNPFGNEVYAYGLRNPQGLAWDDAGRLFITEHGRSGARSGLDEINIIESGGNYGWPYLQGDETCANNSTYSPSWPDDVECNGIAPLRHSGPDITWAPASAATVGNRLFFGGLRGQSLYEATISDDGTEITNVQAHFIQDFGRIRTVKLDPTNKFLYLTTSNTDGRGNPTADDDRIIRIKMSAL